MPRACQKITGQIFPTERQWKLILSRLQVWFSLRHRKWTLNERELIVPNCAFSLATIGKSRDTLISDHQTIRKKWGDSSCEGVLIRFKQIVLNLRTLSLFFEVLGQPKSGSLSAEKFLLRADEREERKNGTFRGWHGSERERLVGFSGEDGDKSYAMRNIIGREDRAIYTSLLQRAIYLMCHFTNTRPTHLSSVTSNE